MSLPTNVGSGRIVGRYVVGVIDSPDDTDDEPELIPARGTITFTPSIGYVPNSTTEIPMTIMKAPITGVLDSEGYLCTPDNTTAPAGGLTRGIKLFATDVGQVTGWTYSVKYSFTPVGTVSPHIPDHTLTVPDKSIQDLTKVAPTPYAPVIGIPQIEATALRAEQAALESALSAQEAMVSASVAQGVRDEADAGLFNGLPGDLSPSSELTGWALTIDDIPSTLTTTLTSNVTVVLPSGPSGKSGTISLIIKQDSIGGWKVSWPTDVMWSYGVKHIVSPNPDSTDLVHLFWSGYKWIGLVGGSRLA